MSEHNIKPHSPGSAEPREASLEGQPMAEQSPSLDAEEVDERWKRTNGLPEEEDDNFPAASDEALPDEAEERLIQRDLLGEDGRPEDE